MAEKEYTVEELRQELAAAEEAGKTNRAAAIRDLLKIPQPAAAPDPVAPRTPATNAESFGRGIVQGGTFGSSDELSGLIGAGIDRLTGLDAEQAQLLGQPTAAFSENYRGLRDAERMENAQARRDNPYFYGAGEFTGGFAIPGGGAFKGAQALANATRLTPLGGLAVSGGLGGAIGGAGYSEADLVDGEVGEFAQDVGVGSGVGAVLAPVAGKGIELVGRGLSNVAGGLRRRLASTPEEQARLRVARALADEELGTVQQVRERLDELGPEARLADIGPVLQHEAIVASKGARGGRRFAQEAVEARQRGQEGRLMDVTQETIDPKWRNYNEYRRTLREEGKAQSSAAYDAADQVPITATPEMSRIAQTPIWQAAEAKARKNIGNKIDIGGDGGAPGGSGQYSTRFMDQIGRELKDAADSAYRKGANERARDIRNIRRAWYDEIYKQNPALQEAMSIYRGSAALNEAAETGRDILRGNRVFADDLDEIMAEYSTSEVDSFRVGLMRGIFDRLESATETQSSGGRLLNSSRVNKLLRRFFKDDETAMNKFMNAVEAENRMQGTRNKVMGGSPTSELTRGADQVPDLARGRGVIGAVQDILLKLGAEEPDLRKLTEADFEEISRIMFGKLSDDQIQQLLTPTLRSRLADQGIGGRLTSMAGTGTTIPVLQDFQRILTE